MIENYQAWEVEQYRLYGNYPDRITRDSSGQEYMIGDWSWNRLPQNKREFFEPVLRQLEGQHTFANVMEKTCGEFVLAPLELTERMFEAGKDRLGRARLRELWRDLIAAYKAGETT